MDRGAWIGMCEMGCVKWDVWNGVHGLGCVDWDVWNGMCGLGCVDWDLWIGMRGLEMRAGMSGLAGCAYRQIKLQLWWPAVPLKPVVLAPGLRKAKETSLAPGGE